jgi:biotin carboxylase
MRDRKVLLLCPTRRAGEALSALGQKLDCRIIEDERSRGSFLSNSEFGDALDIVDMIESRVRQHRDDKIDGITCAVAFPGMNVAAACIAEHLGLPGPSPMAILTCEHKYYCRVAQQKFVPDATADFQIIAENDLKSLEAIRFPRFVKPVKSILSSGAFTVNNQEELMRAISSDSLPKHFLKPFNELIKKYSDFEYNADYFLVEELLEGWQVSLEGFVYQGEITIMGIVDSLMFPGTISFKRFQYPSCLSETVQERMCDIATRLMRGIKYDNWAFNIEMMYNPVTERIHIIEVNARLASQFWDLFEKVDGSNPYEAILKIALGERPTFEKRQGRFKVAGSCVLRTFEDRLVKSVPAERDIAAVHAIYPDAKIEIFAKVGKRLSEQIQDSGSFRYGLVNIGADSYEHLESKFEECSNMLPFVFNSATVLDSGA